MNEPLSLASALGVASCSERFFSAVFGGQCVRAFRLSGLGFGSSAACCCGRAWPCSGFILSWETTGKGCWLAYSGSPSRA